MRVPVLMYHAVLPIDRAADVRGTVPLPAFRDQMTWLARRGFTSVGLGRLLDLLAGRERAPRRPIAITFDDGYRSVVEHALPVLSEVGFTATLFVVTGAVGGESHFYAKKGGPAFAHAGWEELERAVSQGFAVGSHGVSHLRLGGLSAEACDEELVRSRETIATRLGSCAHFAYPYGDAPPRVVERVGKAGYASACTTARGWNRPGTPVLELARQTVSRTTGARRFKRRVGLWW